MIIKNSNEEKNFIAKLIIVIRNINTNDISDIDTLKNIIQSLAHDIERI